MTKRKQILICAAVVSIAVMCAVIFITTKDSPAPIAEVSQPAAPEPAAISVAEA